MVQEFHVLRCFSCETFQVQQVKKSKKWSCNMCGEKQSLIKEYGRGTGADCRRHVQKLNLLRGELLEVENEKAWTQWEKEKCEAKEGFVDEAESCEKQGELQGVSRWSKYVDQVDSGPRGDGDDQEDENVYTDRERFTRRYNTSRKRKKSFTSRGAGGHYTICEDDVTCTQDITVHWRTKELLIEPQLDGNALSGHCSGTNKQPSAELTTKHASLSASNPFEATSSFPSLSDAVVAGGSKWIRFLTTANATEDKSEKGEEDYAQMSPEATGADVHHFPSALSQVKPVPQVTDGNSDNLANGDSVCRRSLLDEKLGLYSSTASAFEKLSHCLSGGTSTQSSSPTFKSDPFGPEKQVCLQPPPFKRLCPPLSLRTFFYTDEDFDDTF